MINVKTYSELITLPTFEERIKYLKLNANVGDVTFGSERYINQKFYTSYEWKTVRDEVIIRDGGYDLASKDRPIKGRIIVHHMIPLTVQSLHDMERYVLDPNYLISCSIITHNSIHYKNVEYVKDPIERKPNDTIPWR